VIKVWLRLRWQQIKQHRVALVVVGIVLVVLIALIIAGYWFDWTGFNGYNKVTTARITSGTNASRVTRTEEYQPGKSLWDWLQLLFIPAVLTLGAVWITARQNHDLEVSQRQYRTEREVAENNHQEAALQTYIDKMSELLLHAKLRESASSEEARTIARVLTLVVLPQVGKNRKRRVLQFLHEASLLHKDHTIISLVGADLRGANLRNDVLAHDDLHYINFDGADMSTCILDYSNLSHASLNKTDLSYAGLVEANLIEADLREANLKGASVTPEQLNQARSLKGATMPDGSIHP
jgi:uncharacterized protein YjbI with pentapeptide repeats